MGLSSAGDVFTTRYSDAIDYTIVNCSGVRITLNVKKIVYDKPEVVFGGYLINEKGYPIDPALLTASSEFQVPKSQIEIRSFCGLTNQMCKI
jgi:hypothetical protein